MDMSLGTRLKEARKKLGITQEKLAKMIGVSKSAIGNYENGTSSPNEPILIALLEALKIDANYLYQDYYKTDETDIQEVKDSDRLEALHQNPRLGLLFDRQMKMSREDVDFMLQMAARIMKERDGED
jgi:transcriptional regulator with XRE-family HTH domain